MAIFALAIPGREVPRSDRLARIAKDNGLHYHDTCSDMNAFIRASGKPAEAFWVSEVDPHHGPKPIFSLPRSSRGV